MKKSSYLFFILATLILVSCNSNDLNEPIEFPQENLNNQIKLDILNNANSFTIEKPIILELIYNYENEFRFPNNYNLRIFEQTQDGWVEIEEIPTERFPKGDVVLSPNIAIPYPYVISVSPQLPDKLQKYKLRVYIFGKMVDNDKLTDVAAFIDVTLQP